MKTEKKLKKIIEFAVERGWEDLKGEYDETAINVHLPFIVDSGYCFGILFSHSFAKAVFGGEGVCSDCGENEEENYDDGICKYCNEDLPHDSNGFGEMEGEPAWQFHLQQAVVSEDPVQYYFDYINEQGKPKD